jgi:transaldolase
MKIFVDSANMNEAAYWIDSGLAEGITTNPTLLRKAGCTDYAKAVREIAERFPTTEVSIQLVSRDEDNMLAEGRDFIAEIPNAVIKVPVIAPSGAFHFTAVSALTRAGIPVNATACLTVGQVVLSAKSGARYASVFWGRIADEGGDCTATVSGARKILTGAGATTKLIAGSIRGAADITAAFLAGADVVTAAPSILRRWADHHYSRATVAQFYSDLPEALQ